MEPERPLYPNVAVRLFGEDANAFAILGRVVRAMKDAKVESDEIAAFHTEATSDDYDHLLRTVFKWVTVEDDDGI